MEIVNTVLQKMSSVKKPQRRFMLMLLPLLLCLRGRANFRNLSRYSPYHEKSFSRWYRRDFDFTEFNRLSLLPLSEEDATLIAATDCSFIPKSGRYTEGLGQFYSGGAGKAEKGGNLDPGRGECDGKHSVSPVHAANDGSSRGRGNPCRWLP